MQLSFTTLDVFTKSRYSGNPLAIVHLPSPSTLTQAQKQSIAKEFNLSETVFLYPPLSDGQPGTVPIDIFTTEAEIPFAGHPTIGTAWFLLHAQKQPVEVLQTKAGIIPIAGVPASTSDSGGGGEPETTPLVRATIPFALHIHAFTFTSPLTAHTATPTHPIVSIVNGMAFILVQLPDLASLGKSTTSLHASPWDTSILDEGWQKGLTGTLFYVPLGEKDGLGRKRYRTRMQAGTEDPATGSASAALAAWLAMETERVGNEGGEEEEAVLGYAFEQGVEMGSPSQIGVEVVKKGHGVEGIKQIVLSGAAVKVMEGTLEV